MSFQDKVVIVTGASSGIGAATAIAFAGEGAKVTMVGRNTSKLKNVAEKCALRGSKPLVVVADVSVSDDCRRIVSETLEQFGKLDVLVNNAGIASTASILAADAMQVFEHTMATNLHSAVLLTHLAAPQLLLTGGNVINVSSIAAQAVVIDNSFAYCVSKAAMDHFTRAVALELGPKGVRVNTVAPGPVRTDVVQKSGMNPAQIEMLLNGLAQHVPLRKIGEPEELADLILFLASHKARSITGVTYTTDNGGLLSGYPRPESLKAFRETLKTITSKVNENNEKISA